MARDLNGSSQYLEIAVPVITGRPFTMACHFNVRNLTATHTLMSVSDATRGSGGFYTIWPRGDQPGQTLNAGYYEYGAAGRYAAATTPYTANAWQHGAGVFAAGDLRAYLNGGNKGTNASDDTLPTGLSHTRIGRLRNDTPVWCNGQIAEAAIWAAALTDAEIAMLALGVSPLLVRPESLVAYWPLIGRTSPEIDLSGGYGMTLINAPPIADHPRVLYPSRTHIGLTPYVAPTPPSGRRRSWVTIIGG